MTKSLAYSIDSHFPSSLPDLKWWLLRCNHWVNHLKRIHGDWDKWQASQSQRMNETNQWMVTKTRIYRISTFLSTSVLEFLNQAVMLLLSAYSVHVLLFCSQIIIRWGRCWFCMQAAIPWSSREIYITLDLDPCSSSTTNKTTHIPEPFTCSEAQFKRMTVRRQSRDHSRRQGAYGQSMV